MGRKVNLVGKKAVSPAAVEISQQAPAKASKEKLIPLQEQLLRVHNRVMKDFTFNQLLSHRRYTKAKVNRAVSMHVINGLKKPELQPMETSKNGIIIYPEMMEYLFYLDGVGKKLFLFLLFYAATPKKNWIAWNPSVRKDFINYCEATEGTGYSESSIRDAMVALGRANVILNLKRNLYMLNPLLAGGSFGKRQDLIQAYCRELARQGKDPIVDFYPKYDFK